MRHLILIVFLAINIYNASAQDAQFSQYLSAPLLLNPALTGITPSDYRLSANYRSQWTALQTPFQTIAISADARPFQFRNHDNLNLGLIVISDKAGDLNFTANGVYASMAYSKNFSRSRNESHYFTLGFQGGHWTSSFDISNIKVVDPSQLSFDFEKNNYWDIATGGLWFYANNNYSIYAGFSAYHLNKPLNSLNSNSEETLYQRQSAHIGGKFRLNHQISILPNAMYQQQGKANMLIVGTYLQLGESMIKDQAAMYFGTWYRWQDGFIFSFKLDYKNISMTLSYDANTSTLSEVSRGFGALEFGLQYHFNQKKTIKRTKYYQCPTF